MLNKELRHWPALASLLFLGNLLPTHWMIGLRPEHFAVALLLTGLAWSGAGGRRFTFLCLPFWLTGVFYEGQRVLLPYRGSIHTGDLYLSELHWFGFEATGGRQIVQDFFLHWTHPALDLVCGFAYLAFLYEPLLMAVYFFVRKRDDAFHCLAWSFLLVNLFGIATYLLYPAAPPWYIQKYGLGPANPLAAADPAGALRFDQLLGINYFGAFYARSANVFGAMPSLHVAYPMICLALLWEFGAWFRLGGAIFAATVAFAAVYLRHHYVWDILLGWTYAGLTLLIVKGSMRRLADRAGASGQWARIPSPASGS